MWQPIPHAPQATAAGVFCNCNAGALQEYVGCELTGPDSRGGGHIEGVPRRIADQDRDVIQPKITRLDASRGGIMFLTGDCRGGLGSADAHAKDGRA